MMKRILVVGATGDVGLGVVSAVLAKGWQVIAAGRNEETLKALEQRHSATNFSYCVGDLATESKAQQLWACAVECFGGVEAVVVAVNAPNVEQPLLTWDAERLNAVFSQNVLTHFNAAKVFIPALPKGGVFVGIGGGTADFIAPNIAQLSMMQAAQRMMYRGIAKENKGLDVEIRELMILSMVNGESSRDRAEPTWLTDEEIGRHLCAIIETPSDFPKPILSVSAREQVGVAG